MGKKDKKKGKGAEKTAAKTEKKTAQKLKKELASKGEEDIESLLAKFQAEDQKRDETVEDLTTPPSLRLNFSLTAHPLKEELILFGGEYFMGNKTFVYNDLFFYNIKKNEWRKVTAVNCPLPRCAHQAVAVPKGEGQLWVFGGEFTNTTQSQFHHYKDLWVFHLQKKTWEKISASGGPSSRSGHRMVVNKKHLVVFGGFHDNTRDYKYFNDVYLFNLETYKWQKIEPSGKAPLPRSACQMTALPDGRILIYGGYSKEHLKKDIDRGVTHNDMFYLIPEKGDQTNTKWKWQQVSQSGCKPIPRCSFALTTIAPNRAVMFGGVYDKEDSDEQLEGVCLNDMYQLDLEQARWHEVCLTGKQNQKERKSRRRKKTPVESGASATEEVLSDESFESDNEEEPNIDHKLKVMKLEEENSSDQPPTTLTTDDGVFSVTIGPQINDSAAGSSRAENQASPSHHSHFCPRPRMNPGLAFKSGHLYLYGGCYEDGDKQITLQDFYSLDVHKFDEWNTIIAIDSEKQEWFDSESSSSESEEETDDEADADEPAD